MKLNDTGIQFCSAYPGNGIVACGSAQLARQDAQFGRDAQATAGTLTKVGGGNAGFDFTALDSSGNPTSPGSGTNPHACVRDNVTGLVWEVKTDDGGLRDKDWNYTWYNSNSPDGYPGTSDGGTCYQSGHCDTEKYVADVNAAGLCGYHDWRMPTRKELANIADLGRADPAIDPTYFPNTQSRTYHSASPQPHTDSSDSYSVWNIDFSTGAGSADNLRDWSECVRLVRDGQ